VFSKDTFTAFPPSECVCWFARAKTLLKFDGSEALMRRKKGGDCN